MPVSAELWRFPPKDILPSEAARCSEVYLSPDQGQGWRHIHTTMK